MQNPNEPTLYERIKLDILNNALPLDKALKQEALSAKYGVSRIPIRDTLRQLKHDGWLLSHGKRGVMIAPLVASEAEDLYQMRMHIEPLILQYAIKNMTRQILGEAEDICHRIEHHERLSMQELGELNWQFHACLYKCAQRATMFAAIAQLHQQCSRYIGYHNQTLNYIDTSENEHKALIKALADKDLLGAQCILKNHISQAGEILVSHLIKTNQVQNEKIALA